MTDAFIEQLRPLGFEKYASRLTRIVGNATQVVVGGDQVRRGLAPDETGAVIEDGGDAVDPADEGPLAAADQAHAKFAIQWCVDSHDVLLSVSVIRE